MVISFGYINSFSEESTRLTGRGWNLNRALYRRCLADLLTVGHLSKVRRHILPVCFPSLSKLAAKGHLQKIGICGFCYLYKISVEFWGMKGDGSASSILFFTFKHQLHTHQSSFDETSERYMEMQNTWKLAFVIRYSIFDYKMIISSKQLVRWHYN